MKTSDVRDLALKLFGITFGVKFAYALYQSVASLVSAFRQSESVVREMNFLANRPVYVILVFLWPVFYLSLIHI